MVNATVYKTVPTWFTGSIPVTPIESSAIHSLVFRFRLRKADGMVSGGDVMVRSMSRYSASGQRCASASFQINSMLALAQLWLGFLFWFRW